MESKAIFERVEKWRSTSMQKELHQAIVLRNEGKFKESNEILVKLVHEFPEDSFTTNAHGVLMC